MFSSQEPSTKSTKKPRTVQYRPRHKRLEHLEKEVTQHGFEQRLKTPGSHDQHAQQVYCGVWEINEGGTAEIEINSRNYRAALDQLGDSTGIRDRRTPHNPPTGNNSYHIHVEGNNGPVPSYQSPPSSSMSSAKANNYRPTPTAAENMGMHRQQTAASSHSGPGPVYWDYSNDAQALYQYHSMTPENPETEDMLTEAGMESYLSALHSLADPSRQGQEPWVSYQHDQAQMAMWDQGSRSPMSGSQDFQNSSQYMASMPSNAFNNGIPYSNHPQSYQRSRNSTF